MNIQEIATVISNIGFPSFVATYFLLYNTKIIRENTEATKSMKESLDRISRVIERDS